MRAIPRSRGLLATSCVAALALAVPTIAANVNGGAGNDILRGTPAADRINGKAGNDRLFGLAGNDTLTGGPGADYVNGGPGDDRLFLRDGARDRAICGAGRDRVVADLRDRVAADCEIVLRPSQPSPPPPAPPPPPPPPPAPSPITSGSYRGATQSGNFVFFDVLENRTVLGWRVNDVRRPCDAGNLIIYGPVDFGTYAERIDDAGRFVTEFDYDTSIIWDENGDQSPARGHIRVAGIIQGTAASGTVLSSFEFDRDGQHYRCSNGDETWTANRLP
jgi:hypothetical protein